MADRRTALRFEILGRLRGTITAQRQVRLHNISGGGALIETPWPIERNVLMMVKLESSTHLATLEARVCHVRPNFDNTAYIVGLQFTASHAEDELARLIPTAIAIDAQPS